MATNEVYVASRRDLNEAFSDGIKDIVPSIIENIELPERPRKEILSNREARELLDASRSTLQRWRDEGILPFSKVEGSIYYEREKLLRVVREHRV